MFDFQQKSPVAARKDSFCKGCHAKSLAFRLYLELRVNRPEHVIYDLSVSAQEPLKKIHPGVGGAKTAA